MRMQARSRPFIARVAALILHAAGLLSFSLCGGMLQAAQSAFLVDDFQKNSVHRSWQFSTGSEFPGASGSLWIGSGHSGAGARLNYRIRCWSKGQMCGHYVAAYKNIFPPADTQFHAASLWVRISPEMRLVLRVIDETGQTLQYQVDVSTFEHQETSTWTPVFVSLDASPDCYWGGVNSGHLTGLIKKIGILADSRFSMPSKGSLYFDDVELLTSSVTKLDLDAGTAVAAVPSASVPLFSRLGVNVHCVSDDVAFDSARSAGFTFVRTDLVWAQIENRGQYTFSTYDRLLASLEARGMGVLWILDYGHPDHGGAQLHTAEDIAAYGRFAQATAEHFQGHHVRFEIWNEPNSSGFLARPAVYPKLLRAAIRGIRQADQVAAISTGGVAGIDLGFLGNSSMVATERRTDAIGVHPFRTAAPETVGPDLILLRRLIDTRIRRGMSIWATEWGYSSCDRASDSEYVSGDSDSARKHQAVLAARHVLTIWALGLPVAVWYDLRDDGSDPTDPEMNFGLLDQYGNDKAAMTAVRVLNRIAGNSTLAGIVTGVPAGTHALKLQNKIGATFIIWNDSPGAMCQVLLPPAAVEAVTDVIGRELSVGAEKSNKAMITVTESDGPVYVQLKQSASSSSR